MILVYALTALSLVFAQPSVARPPEDEIGAAQEWLARAQHLSFATNREYCGYLGYTQDGQIGFTEMQRGGHDGCTPWMTDNGLALVASLHTHGAYDPDVPAEFPTSLDIDSDAREGVDGYISTPGGRLWYVDSIARVAIQICGLNCLPQDHSFRAGDDGMIRDFYSQADLRRLEDLD